MTKSDILKSELQKMGVLTQMQRGQYTKEMSVAILKKASVVLFGNILADVIRETAYDVLDISYDALDAFMDSDIADELFDF